MGLFSRRDHWKIDWDSPDLQPINGVSLKTYVRVNPIPWTGGPPLREMRAQPAGVAVPEWTAAALDWQTRIASNVMVASAMHVIMDPDVTPGRTHGA